MLQAIPAQCVPNVWATCAPLLQRAIDKTQRDFLIDDILRLLLSEDMQLWIWVEDFKIVACCITTITIYPQRKVCQLPYIAGSGLKRFLTCEAQFITWAKAHGCTQFEGFDRGGWLRILQPRGWFKVWTTIRKDI